MESHASILKNELQDSISMPENGLNPERFLLAIGLRGHCLHMPLLQTLRKASECTRQSTWVATWKGQLRSKQLPSADHWDLSSAQSSVVAQFPEVHGLFSGRPHQQQIG